MEYKFSEELRKKYILYFKTKHGVEFTHDEADQHLSSLAKLYEFFSRKEK